MYGRRRAVAPVAVWQAGQAKARHAAKVLVASATVGSVCGGSGSRAVCGAECGVDMACRQAVQW